MPWQGLSGAVPSTSLMHLGLSLSPSISQFLSLYPYRNLSLSIYLAATLFLSISHSLLLSTFLALSVSPSRFNSFSIGSCAVNVDDKPGSGPAPGPLHVLPLKSYPTESVYKVVLQRSISVQIRQLIRDISHHKEQVDGFVRECLFKGRLHTLFL